MVRDYYKALRYACQFARSSSQSAKNLQHDRLTPNLQTRNTSIVSSLSSDGSFECRILRRVGCVAAAVSEMGKWGFVPREVGMGVEGDWECQCARPASLYAESLWDDWSCRNSRLCTTLRIFLFIAWRIWWILPSAVLTAGSKRRIPERRDSCSKRSRKLDHQIGSNWLPDSSMSDFNSKMPMPDSLGKDCGHPNTSRSKFWEPNSHYLLVLVLELAWDPYNLYRRRIWRTFIAVIWRRLLEALRLRKIRRIPRVEVLSVSAESNSVEATCKEEATSTGRDSLPNGSSDLIIHPSPKPRPSSTATWESLPDGLHVNILRRVKFEDRFRFRAVSKDSKKLIELDGFRQSSDGVSEGVFTAINYYIKSGTWRRSEFDVHSRSWKALPTLSYLPPRDHQLFKEYSVCGHGGLMCAGVSTWPNKGELSAKRGEVVVFNPLTRESQAYPPLLHPRTPVLVHISVDSAEKSYKAVVAGSSSASDELLAKKVENFDSKTSEWESASDLPVPAFGLNEHQSGVCLKGTLFFISFLESGGRDVIALDLEKGTWRQDLFTLIPRSYCSNTSRLVESGGKLFLFSEQEQGPSMEHCIDELQFSNPEAGVFNFRWRSVLGFVKSGGRGLQVYPEYTCMVFVAEKLRIVKGLLSRLLFVGGAVVMATGVRAEDHLEDSMGNSSDGWPVAAVVTGLLGLSVVAAGAAWGLFRLRRDPYDITRGLENSATPTKSNSVYTILDKIQDCP